jgi:hypothetical protein
VNFSGGGGSITQVILRGGIRKFKYLFDFLKFMVKIKTTISLDAELYMKIKTEPKFKDGFSQYVNEFLKISLGKASFNNKELEEIQQKIDHLSQIIDKNSQILAKKQAILNKKIFEIVDKSETDKRKAFQLAEKDKADKKLYLQGVKLRAQTIKLNRLLDPD